CHGRRPVQVRYCCISLLCRPVDGLRPAQHCAVRKTSCSGASVIYELLTAPPSAYTSRFRRLGGAGSYVYAISDPEHLKRRYYWHVRYTVCYPCRQMLDGSEEDPVACACVTDQVVCGYGWRHGHQYRPASGSLLEFGSSAIELLLVGGAFEPNSNSFAKYWMHRCTKIGRRPKRPRNAPGWGFEFGARGPNYPPPWGGRS